MSRTPLRNANNRTDEQLLKKAAGYSSAQLERAAFRFKLKFIRGITRAMGVGDSYMLGSGASAAAKAMFGLISAELGRYFAFLNFGFSGKPMSAYQYAPLVSGSGPASLNLLEPVPSDLFFGILGLNDLRGVNAGGGGTGGCGSDPANFPQMQAKAQALVTWLLAPETSRVRMHTKTNSGPNPAVTFTGTWDHAGGFGANFSFSSGSGDKAAFTTPPGDLLVIRFGADASSSTTCSVTVDGVVMGYFSSKALYDNWSLSSIIIPLPTNRAHEVVLTQTSSGNMMVDSVDCVDTSTDFGGTLLWSAPAYLPDGAGIGWSSAGGGAANGANAAGASGATAWLYNNGGSDRFAAALETAMNELFMLGFNVVNVHARTGFKQDTHVAADDLHPNDFGHAHLADPFRHGMRLLVR